MNWTLFVEGKWDQAFVRWLLQRLEIDDYIRVRTIGGGVSYLRHVDNEIRKEHDGGRHVALLLDADSDVRHRRDELEEEIARLGLPVSRSFLLPDDDREGDLETLLELMVPTTHQAVYGCFDNYRDCLHSLDPGYETPNRKQRVYAYCQAVGAETSENKNYDDTAHWNAGAAELEPLRRFLVAMAS